MRNEKETEASSEFMVFTLSGGVYGIHILMVQKIRCYEAFPRSPIFQASIKGAGNLCGVIVPVVDMGIKF